jgi:hypothetical protein
MPIWSRNLTWDQRLAVSRSGPTDERAQIPLSLTPTTDGRNRLTVEPQKGLGIALIDRG